MKRNLIYGSVLSMAAMSFFLSSCSEDKDYAEEKAFVHFTATVDEIGNSLRAQWSMSGLNEMNPNWGDAEHFLWDNGDEMVSLFRGKDASEVQYNLPVTTADGTASTSVNLNVQLPKNGTAWFFYPSTSIENYDESSADVENAQVSLTIDATQTPANQKKFAFLRTDEITLKDGKPQSESINFNHLTSLLRFHVWNASGRKYVVKSIKIESSKPTVFLKTGNYKLASQDFMVQKDINNSQFADELIWDNTNYKSDKPLVNDEGTTSSEDIYDALLITFPVEAEQLADVELSIHVTLADAANNYAEFTPNPLVLNSSDYATQFAKGFPRGKRTYFNLKISGSNTLEFANEFEYPGEWSSDEVYVQED